MKLSLNKEYQSITEFEAEELPEFTIITGPNGYGKTHLLKAIEIGSVLMMVVAMNAGGKAKFFDANSIVPKSTGAFASPTLEKLRKAELLKLTRFQDTVRSNLRNHLRVQFASYKASYPQH